MRPTRKLRLAGNPVEVLSSGCMPWQAMALYASMAIFAYGAKARAGTVMSYFQSSDHEALMADPTHIIALYARERMRFVVDLGPGFSAEIEDHIQLGFCSIVSFNLKPYGQSNEVELPALLAAPALDCDNYAILTWRLFLILCPSPQTEVAAVGWNGGAIGNHAQIIATRLPEANGSNRGALIADPTVGVLQCGFSYDWLASGKPMAATSRKDFYDRQGSATDWLHDAVVIALDEGLYKPSDALYFFNDVGKYSSPSPIGSWPTPQASRIEHESAVRGGSPICALA
jgi:hypothetical protein